jgi:hypothetical protein
MGSLPMRSGSMGAQADGFYRSIGRLLLVMGPST